MKLDDFFPLFEAELWTNDELTGYHRMVNSEKLYEFRKAYFTQQRQYLTNSLTKLSFALENILIQNHFNRDFSGKGIIRFV